MSMPLSNEYSVGFFAPAFPRDPLNINVYLEHVLLGQTLEPLFTVGDDGNIQGAVAESWEFDKGRTEVTIYLRKGLVFSNGQTVTSEDVEFSLDRHRQTSSSQSYNFLKVIKSIDVIDDRTIKLSLQSPYIPVLLVLSRDHLGILPKGWKFDPQSAEPYIGTGPYRLHLSNGVWYLVANPHYRNLGSVKIQKWRMEILDSARGRFPQDPPSLILLTPTHVRQKLFSQYPDLSATHTEAKSFSFMQSSFWWLNDQFDVHSVSQRKQIGSVIDQLSKVMASATKGELSSGIIPAGIPGALPDRPMEESLSDHSISIRLLVPDWLLESVREQINGCIQFHVNRINFDLSSYSALDLPKIRTFNADLILTLFAGGFFDPEGFLAVLPAIVGRSTKDLFGERAENLRLKAASEPDRLVRARLYQEFSRIIREEMRYFAGWVPSYSEFRSQSLSKRATAFKYSFKLIDYQSLNVSADF